MTQVVGINVDTYLADKAAGVVKVVKLNGVPHYTGREYDRAGKSQSVLVQVDRDTMAAQLEQLKGSVKGLEQLIADIDNAPEKLADPASA